MEPIHNADGSTTFPRVGPDGLVSFLQTSPAPAPSRIADARLSPVTNAALALRHLRTMSSESPWRGTKYVSPDARS